MEGGDALFLILGKDVGVRGETWGEEEREYGSEVVEEVRMSEILLSLSGEFDLGIGVNG